MEKLTSVSTRAKLSMLNKVCQRFMNLFEPNVPFLYPLTTSEKTPENLGFFTFSGHEEMKY